MVVTSAVAGSKGSTANTITQWSRKPDSKAQRKIDTVASVQIANMSFDLASRIEVGPDLEVSPLPWEAFAEKVIVADPVRYRVVIRAANTYRVAIEENPERWEQALADFERICAVVNKSHEETNHQETKAGSEAAEEHF